MTPRKPHSISCATGIRAQVLYAAGSPDWLDPELLTRVAAEIARHCGYPRIKAFRIAHGWTIARAVAEVHAMCQRDGLGVRGLHERSWKQWEAGGNPGDDYRDLLCRLFQTGPVQLGFAKDYTPAASREGDIGSSTHRRTFVKAATAWGIGSSAELDALFRGISARRSGRIDPDRIKDLSEVAVAYRRGYRDMPTSELLQAAHAHLMLAFALDPRMQPEEPRTQLLSVIAEMAALVGVLFLLDREDQQNGWRYVDLAWEAATAAGSPEMQTIILGGRSLGVAYFSRDHQAGLELAGYAREVASGRVSNETRGWVAAVASERAASLGDLSQCRRLIDASRAALSQPHSDTTPLGIGVFNIDKLAAYEGGDLVRLGRYREAEPALDAAIARLDQSMERHRSTALIDRAQARLGANEVDAACQDGLEALDLVARVQHIRNFKRLQALSSKAMKTGSPAGKEFWQNVITTAAETKGSHS